MKTTEELKDKYPDFMLIEDAIEIVLNLARNCDTSNYTDYNNKESKVAIETVEDFFVNNVFN